MDSGQGDSFCNITNSTVVNRSLVTGSFQRLTEQGRPEAAQALQELGDAVQQSGDQEAVEAYNSLAEELQSAQPKKGVVKALLMSIAASLPAIAAVAESTATISKIFS